MATDIGSLITLIVLVGQTLQQIWDGPLGAMVREMLKDSEFGASGCCG